MRKNDKKQIINYENSIKKSNEFSMAKLNHGLSLQGVLPTKSAKHTLSKFRHKESRVFLR